jgi:hypothetical protein
MTDRFTKIVANMSVAPKRQKFYQSDSATVKLETIGVHSVKITKVTMTVTNSEFADNRNDGGVCVTYWETPWMAEKMYDHHLEWLKSLPGGGLCTKA